MQSNKKAKRTGAVILYITDSHSGHRLGLMRPGVTFEDVDAKGNVTHHRPEPTETQVMIWDVYTRLIDQVQRFADGRPIYFIHGGDECHGIKYTGDLVTPKLSHQITIAVDALDHIIRMPNVVYVRFERGTDAHNFGRGSSVDLVTSLFKERYPKKDIATTLNSVIRLHFDGVDRPFVIDVAHHGPHYGIRSWTRGNVARFYLKDYMIERMRRGERPADLLLRGHYHENLYAEHIERDARYGLVLGRLYSGAALAGLDDYVSQVTKTKDYCRIGGAYFEVDKGRVLNGVPYEVIEEIDLRTTEDITV